MIWAIRGISKWHSGRGIWVMDRGFDRGKLFKELLALKQRFVVRLRGKRRLKWRRGVALASGVRVPMRFSAEVTKVKNGCERRKKIEFGRIAVRLPFSNEQLWLVKVRFDGATQPILLLTNVAIEGMLASVLWVVKAYLSRWRVEEVIRHVKQSYNLEGIRVRSYSALRNMPALVTVCANFVACHLGLRAKLEILVWKLLRASQRVGNIIKNFKYDALADGLKNVLNYMNQPYHQPQPKPPPSSQMTIYFAPAGGCSMR